MYSVITILTYISVIVILLCATIIATHESTRMQKLAMLVCCMLMISSIGFLIKCEAVTEEGLRIGQKLVYASVTHGMFLMLLFILSYCKFKIPRILEWVFHAINIFITLTVLTMDHHTLFYVKTWTEDLGGHVELMKEYGPVHTLAVGVFILYMVSALVITIVFTIKNARTRSHYVWKLMIAVSFPCIAYIIPKLTKTNNEFQPIAFALFTVLLVAMIYKSKLYDIKNIVTDYSLKSSKNAVAVFDSDYSYKGCNSEALDMFPCLSIDNIDKDVRSFCDTLKECLDGKIKEYNFDDKIYNISVRNVCSFGNMIIGKAVWLEDVTNERKYAKLLQCQNEELESQVETLTDISIKDEMSGIFNRRGYEAALEQLRKKEDISDIIVIEADINGLKNANDTLGHTAGDELIIATANIMNKAFSDYGNVYRTGGDEFVAIISKNNLDITVLVEELNIEIAKWTGKINKHLSLSIGYALSSDYPGMNIDKLVIKADNIMYLKKREYYDQLHANNK